MSVHQSVLLHESVEGLSIKPQGIYIDGTFGRGGHTRLILEQLDEKGRLLALDKDLDAIVYANEHFSKDTRFQIIKTSFAQLKHVAQKMGVFGNVDGILLDLGVSSPQLDESHRGFSFMHSGPLDMRMDHEQRMDAAMFVNQANEEEMTFVFKTYGEERFARRIARAIIKARTLAAITTTDELARIVKEANPKWEKHKHPATRVFQAIRIYINHELDDLKTCLEQSIPTLKYGGRLVVISFHSLEDRLVKQFMRQEELGIQLPRDIPIKSSELKSHFKRIGKAIKPSSEELKNNVRARSAILRIGEKTA